LPFHAALEAAIPCRTLRLADSNAAAGFQGFRRPDSPPGLIAPHWNQATFMQADQVVWEARRWHRALLGFVGLRAWEHVKAGDVPPGVFPFDSGGHRAKSVSRARFV